MIRKSVISLGPLMLVLLGCGGIDQGGWDEGDSASLGTTSEALCVDVTPLAVTREFMPLDLVYPAGVAGGREVVFVGSPFESRVAAYSRLTKEPIGDLPAPPGGFILPFIMKSLDGERVAVLDAGGFPSPVPFIPAIPIIHEYSYSYSPTTGFSAVLERTIDFQGATIGFSEDAVRLPDGRYLVSDAILGGLWLAETDGTIKPAIIPETFEREDAIPELAFCTTMPVVEVGGKPFLFSGATIPGVSGLTERDGTLYFTNSCAGAVYTVPVASLDDERAPWERAADIELLSSKPAWVEVEELLALTVNPFDLRDPYLYAADALQLQVIRIHSQTGERDVVADNPRLLNFPSSMAFLPPIMRRGPTPLLVVSNQQHLTPLLNAAATEDAFELPFLVTEIRLKGGHRR